VNAAVRSAVEEYLFARRQLGYDMLVEGAELRRFARYAEGVGHEGPITTALAVRWALLPIHADPLYRARRLDMVRRFARYRASFDPETEVPPIGILGPSYRRPTPYIYSPQEIRALLDEAGRLGPRGGLRPHTYTTLFGLLACSGLRVSEALRLRRSDVDLGAEMLTVTRTKFHKSRLVPLHPSAVGALAAYASHRDNYLPIPAAPGFFLTERGTGLKYHKTYMTFRQLRRTLGWTSAAARLPRIHDLRHTFAVRTLQRWYEEGQRIGNRIAALSTYLGHVKVTDTYWYLSAAPDLLAAAGARFEACADLGFEEVRP